MRYTTLLWFMQLVAPRPGLEPGTIALHVIHHFRDSMDYIFALVCQSGRLGTLVSSLYGAPSLSRGSHGVGMALKPKRSPLSKRVHLNIPVEGCLLSLTGRRSTIELPRNVI